MRKENKENECFGEKKQKERRTKMAKAIMISIMDHSLSDTITFRTHEGSEKNEEKR